MNPNNFVMIKGNHKAVEMTFNKKCVLTAERQRNAKMYLYYFFNFLFFPRTRTQ